MGAIDMNEATIAIYIKAAFSASFLVSESDGEITAEEVAAFMEALKELRDFDLDEDEVWESFRDALEVDEDEHLGRVAGAAGLSEDLRREILNIALAVATADGEVSLSEILCLPNIARALGIELEGDEDDDEGFNVSVQVSISEDESDDDDEADPEDAEEDDGEGSESLSTYMREAEAALRAEGNQAPSAAEITQRAASDMLSGMAGNLEAALLQRRGFAAWQAGDYQLARTLYLEAAEAGDVDALYNIGQMHMAGEGVPVDWAEALSCWVRAAEKGHLLAQRNAWKTLAFGRAGKPDELKAIELAILAARQGDEESARFVSEKTLTSLQASALIAASLMAGADGEVSDGELTAFGEAWKKAVGADYSLDELRGAFAEYSGDREALTSVLPSLRASLPLEMRQRVLQVSILVALSDRHFSPEEMAMVESLAEALDVDLSDIGNGLGLLRAADDEETEVASAEEEDFDPQTNPVLVASLNGDAGKVRELLGEGYSATDIHASGTDAVIIAVREGHLEIVRLLLEAGADPDRINSQSGTTPLRMAVQENRAEIAEYLLSKGADPDLHDPSSGIGALAILLLVARTYEHGSALRLLDLLLAKGAGLHPFRIEDHELSIISFAAIQAGLPAGFIARLAERSQKEDVDLALWYACIEDQAENVRDLIAAGADVNMAVPELEHDPSAAGDCPLNAAATRGHAECVRLLIEAGADVNRSVPPEGGQFPLLMAAENGHGDVVGMLVDAGADVSGINPENGTHALGGAVLHGHAEIVNLLLEAGADPNIESSGYGGPVITFAAHGGHLAIVQSLIKHGAETNAAGAEFGNTALILASNQGHTEIVDLLLQHGADLRKINPVNGSDALLAAVMGGNAGCVRRLLEAGADPNKSYNGKTGMLPLLVLAADKGNAEIVRLLVEHQADVTVTDGDGLTALQRAGIYPHKEVEAILIRFGADPSTRLKKFTETTAGQEMQNEILGRMAENLKETARTIRDTKSSPSVEEYVPQTPPRGFWAKLFGWGRRP